jgi:hypothetical protein
MRCWGCGKLLRALGLELRRSAWLSGRSAAWLARLVRDQEVEGSNPFAPTIPLRTNNLRRTQKSLSSWYETWRSRTPYLRWGTTALETLHRTLGAWPDHKDANASEVKELWMCCADCDRALPHVYEVAGSAKHGSELLPLNTHVSHVLNHVGQ